LPVALLAAWVALALLSAALGPEGWVIWFLEVGPVLLALAILIPTYRRFRFTDLVYVWIFVHACVLTYGAHYTYAKVPLGFWIQDALGWGRNPYDGIGHFFQGFVPALVAREVLLRTSPLERGKWLFFLVVCVCTAFSALYELIEWWVALTSDEAGGDFLGTQGDEWDTQKDMALCLLASILAQLFLGGAQDRQLAAQTNA
jgi:putative membrane protein